MVRAIVFDFDGLILDTEVPYLQAWQELYRERGCEVPLDRWALGVGIGSGHGQPAFDPYACLEELLGQPCDRAEVRLRVRGRRDAMIAAQSPRPGVVAYLDEARRLGLSLAVASSSTREWVAGHLERLGLLDRFELLRCGGEVPRHKPAPDLYLAALEGLGVRADEAIALEDSPNGVRAAREAGIFCVAVPNPVTAALDLSHADLRLTSLADLPLVDLIERVAGARARAAPG